MGLLKLKSCLKILGILLGILSCTMISQAAGLSAAHRLQIELIPDEKNLIGRDDITIQTNGIQVLEFRLSRTAYRSSKWKLTGIREISILKMAVWD